VALRALVFDFDGLICDTEWPEYASVADTFTDHGVELPPEEWVHVIGSAWDLDWLGQLEARLGRAVDRDEVVAARRARRDELLAGCGCLPGVVELVGAAADAGLRLAVASSSPRSWVVPHLERLGVAPRFPVVVTRDDVERAKPAPDLFLAACRRLEVAPGEAVALEDSAPGVAAAVAAGLRCVVVPNRLTALTDLGQAHARLASLLDADLRALEALLPAAAQRPT